MLEAARRAIRGLVRRPGFSIPVILTLTLCIGANGFVFALVNDVLLRPLPYPLSAELISVTSRSAAGESDISPATFFEWRTRLTGFVSLSAFLPGWNLTIVDADRAVRLEAVASTADLPATLGVSPILGRWFARAEEWDGAGREVVISYRLWQERFAARPSVLGTQIHLAADGWPMGRRAASVAGDVFTIVGVASPELRIPEARADVFVPLRALGDDRQGLAPVGLSVIGRVAGGFRKAPHGESIRRIAAEAPSLRAGAVVAVASWRDEVVGSFDRYVHLLSLAVLVVLFLGALNVTTLFALQALRNARDDAIRAALGADQWRIRAPMFAEWGVLGMTAVIASTLVSIAANSVIRPMLPAGFPRLNEIGFGWAEFAATVVLTAVVLAAAGFGGDLAARHVDRVSLLRTGGRGGTVDRRGGRVRLALVCAQASLCLVLVAAAATLGGSLQRLMRVDPGFDARSTVSVKVTVPRGISSSPASRTALFARAIEQVASMPNVTAATAVEQLPLHDAPSRQALAVAGAADFGDERPFVETDAVFPGYFAALRIPLVAGRDVSPLDQPDSARSRVAIVNRAFAKRFLPTNAIGARIALGGGATPRAYEVIGIVADAHTASLRRAPAPQVFLSAPQAVGSTVNVVARVRGSADRMEQAMLERIAGIDPRVAPYEFVDMSSLIARSAMAERLAATLVGAFGLIGLTLVAGGVFGVMLRLVQESRREIGIRVALGATTRHVVQHTASFGGIVLACALGVGVPAAVASGSMLEALLFETANAEPAAMAGAVAAMIAVVALASLPAVRLAMRVDPLSVIRSDG